MSRMNFVCNACKDAVPAIRKTDSIIVHGAREHNLKNICFEIREILSPMNWRAS